MGGRAWVMLSLLSGALAIALFGAVVLASGGHPVTIVRAEPLATPGQPVDTPFIYAAPEAAPVRPSTPAATSQPTQNPGQATTVSTSASENNAAPDISAPPNPFTAGIH